MLATDIPTKFNLPFGFAASGPNITYPVPQPSQSGGRASLTDGFPPSCFQPVTAGGIPPWGADFNGLLYQVSAWSRWLAAGAPVYYDAAFQTAISGYPKDAVVLSNVWPGLSWRSLVDSNASNPDTGGANWSVVRRARLTANTTFYVSQSGNNSNTGLTVGSPWLTPQYAVNVLQTMYDFNGFFVTIQLADAGPNYGDITVNGPWTGGNYNAGQPVALAGGTTAGTKVGNIYVTSFAGLQVGTMTIGNGAYGVSASSFGSLTLYNSLIFAAGSGYQIDCRLNGLIYVASNYTIAGSAPAHFSVLGGGAINMAGGLTITLSGTPAFSQGFAILVGASRLYAPSTSPFSGAATGARYNVNENSVITGTVGNTSFFPGNSAGLTATGGQYT